MAAAALIATGCSSTETKQVASTATDHTGSAAATATGATATTAAPASHGSSVSRRAAAGSSVSHFSAAARPGEVKAKGVDGSDVTLTGPIAARYSAATAAQKHDLGPVLMGDHNAGTRPSGVIFQQFQGGVITAKNANAGTPAFITWGKIRDAWNVERDADGKPIAVGGSNGSAGPLGTATSDEITSGAVKQTTFEHGKVTYNTQTGKVEVTVNGRVVPAGL
jgi:hypothetical protein